MAQGDLRRTLRAGAAAVDITPAMGTQIDGSIGIRRPAEQVVDPIFARALVMESGGRKVCVLSLDLLAATRPLCDELRAHVAERIGTTPDAVMVHVTQNHAAPSLGHLMCDEENDIFVGELEWMRGSDKSYFPVAVSGALEAAVRADAALRPVRVGVERGIDGRCAFNRRYVLRDGRAEMGHGGDVRNVLHREGPIDPEVGVACFQTESLKPVALLLHHTCHPVHAYPKRYITADWPGAWCSAMRRACGEATVPLVLNGCCGNIAHHDLLTPGHRSTSEGMGAMLAETARAALERIRYAEDADTTVDWLARMVSIPYRDLSPERLAEARKALQEQPHPPPSPTKPGFFDWDWIYHVGVLDVARLKERTGRFEYEIQAFRIGDLALVALVGEPFVQGQLRIKLESPFPFTFVAHMCNAYVGYLPTPEAIERGGYETRLGWGSKLAPEALDMVADATVALLKDLHAGRQG